MPRQKKEPEPIRRLTITPPGTNPTKPITVELPDTPEWQALALYVIWLDRWLNRVKQSLVSLEKKVHFHLPTQAVLIDGCSAFRCVERRGEEVPPEDVLDAEDGDEEDEGRKPGAGGEPPPQP